MTIIEQIKAKAQDVIATAQAIVALCDSVQSDPQPEPQPGRLDLDRFSWTPAHGGAGTLTLPRGFVAKRIGLSRSSTSGFIGTLMPSSTGEYAVNIPAGDSLCVQMHGALAGAKARKRMKAVRLYLASLPTKSATEDVLEFRFDPRTMQNLASVRCTYYPVASGKPPSGWNWKQKGATKWERVP